MSHTLFSAQGTPELDVVAFFIFFFGLVAWGFLFHAFVQPPLELDRLLASTISLQALDMSPTSFI